VNGFLDRTPVVTAYSNSPRTAAIRRLIVDGASPCLSANRTTADPGDDCRRRACQSR